MSLPRMRTAGKVMEIIQEQDPDTDVTLHYIRNLIKTGEIPVTPVGRKKLVDADAVIAHIAAGQAPPTSEAAKLAGQIRRVPK